MRSHTANIPPPAHTSGQRYSRNFILGSEIPVMDEEAGQSLEYRQLRKHPKYQKIWNTSYPNELGRLCQGVGKGTYGPHNQTHQEGGHL